MINENVNETVKCGIKAKERSLHRSEQPTPALLGQKQGDKSDHNKGVQAALFGYFKGKARHTATHGRRKTAQGKPSPPRDFLTVELYIKDTQFLPIGLNQ